MTNLTPISFVDADLDMMTTAEGCVAVTVSADGKLGPAARRANKLTRGAVVKLVESKSFANAKNTQVFTLAQPGGMAAEALLIVVLDRKASVIDCRKAGAGLAKAKGKSTLSVWSGNLRSDAELAGGIVLRDYRFDDHKTDGEIGETQGEIVMHVGDAAATSAAAVAVLAVAEGVHMTRDLVNEPANVLTTTEFANRLVEMESIGLKVEILDEPALAELGMGSLLCVGQGSDSPSKVAVMQWNGGADGDAPLALIGKGVVFDTGGISLKPAGGMEDMTMDMGGAGVVAGTMRALALRKAPANVVGLVGLVENMPSGNAVRPGDVVKSMKGDTIEVINTDAEGRLVLADVLWYAQERFNPTAMIDLATLTGAIIVGLGHDNAGVFSNNDTFCRDFLDAADGEGEGAWRLPMGKSYDDQLKSRIADMKNVGTRAAGSITAAQFLQRFVKDGTPWIHLDIAGVASVKTDTDYAPKGATGWGVMALNRLVSDQFETDQSKAE
jgi:leucyl aminopeptidase